MSDEDVRAFSSHVLHTQPHPRKTALLCTLRSSGLSCEQERFGRLFEVAQRRE